MLGKILTLFGLIKSFLQDIADNFIVYKSKNQKIAISKTIGRISLHILIIIVTVSSIQYFNSYNGMIDTAPGLIYRSNIKARMMQILHSCGQGYIIRWSSIIQNKDKSIDMYYLNVFTCDNQKCNNPIDYTASLNFNLVQEYQGAKDMDRASYRYLKSFNGKKTYMITKDKLKSVYAMRLLESLSSYQNAKLSLVKISDDIIYYFTVVNATNKLDDCNIDYELLTLAQDVRQVLDSENKTLLH